MLELLSIHIPKTGGTSFHQILQEAYGPEKVSSSLKRKDIRQATEQGSLEDLLEEGVQVLHGHFYYREIKALHQKAACPVISWVRHPVERVISNYYFFLHRLHHPELNPETFALNKHRLEESLLVYAARSENRNRMSQFLQGLPIAKYHFIGRLEHFEDDLKSLADRLAWQEVPTVAVQNQNKAFRSQQRPISAAEQAKIEKLNKRDMQLYRNIQKLWT